RDRQRHLAAVQVTGVVDDHVPGAQGGSGPVGVLGREVGHRADRGWVDDDRHAAGRPHAPEVLVAVANAVAAGVAPGGALLNGGRVAPQEVVGAGASRWYPPPDDARSGVTAAT